jgi:two-component system response regulator YesN
MLFYEEDEQIRRKLRGELGVKLLVASNEDISEILTRLIRVFTRILLQEFPSRADIQERLGTAWPGQKADRDKALSAITGALERAEKLYKDLFSGMSPIVQRTVKCIRAKLREGLSLKVLCTQLGMNPAYLGHIFKQETGMFFNDYVTRLRIEKSLALLAQGNLKIKDVAAQVGFFSTSYYEKCFKKQMGVSPLQYRLEPMDETSCLP